MTTNKRLQQLLIFLEEEPQDAFLLYAIALEYLKEDSSKALKYLEELLKTQPEYTATYYQLAALYIDGNELEKAKKVFEQGIEVCKKEDDQKNFEELSKAYEQFLFEFD